MIQGRTTKVGPEIGALFGSPRLEKWFSFSSRGAVLSSRFGYCLLLLFCRDDEIFSQRGLRYASLSSLICFGCTTGFCAGKATLGGPPMRYIFIFEVLRINCFSVIIVTQQPQGPLLSAFAFIHTSRRLASASEPFASMDDVDGGGESSMWLQRRAARRSHGLLRLFVVLQLLGLYCILLRPNVPEREWRRALHRDNGGEDDAALIASVAVAKVDRDAQLGDDDHDQLGRMTTAGFLGLVSLVNVAMYVFVADGSSLRDGGFVPLHRASGRRDRTQEDAGPDGRLPSVDSLHPAGRSAPPGNRDSTRVSTPHDSLLRQRPPPNVCRHCGCQRPLRAYHCHLCGRCVRRHDHHCGWLGLCIGETNIAPFGVLIMLLTITVGWGLRLVWLSAKFSSRWRLYDALRAEATAGHRTESGGGIPSASWVPSLLYHYGVPMVAVVCGTLSLLFLLVQGMLWWLQAVTGPTTHERWRGGHRVGDLVVGITLWQLPKDDGGGHEDSDERVTHGDSQLVIETHGGHTAGLNGPGRPQNSVARLDQWSWWGHFRLVVGLWYVSMTTLRKRHHPQHGVRETATSVASFSEEVTIQFEWWTPFDRCLRARRRPVEGLMPPSTSAAAAKHSPPTAGSERDDGLVTVVLCSPMWTSTWTVLKRCGGRLRQTRVIARLIARWYGTPGKGKEVVDHSAVQTAGRGCDRFHGFEADSQQHLLDNGRILWLSPPPPPERSMVIRSSVSGPTMDEPPLSFQLVYRHMESI